MTEGTADNQDSGALLKVLTAHYHALVSARCDETILRQYSSLLRFLKSKPPHFLDGRGDAKAPRSARSRPIPTINEEELRRASLDDLEKIVTDAKTARRDLEFIAVQRFSVPHGSMRTFANRDMLVDKLRTLIGNERAHEAIGAVAREQGKRT
ncbi:MAG: hypothetical protein DMG15_07320 [Acidobacteria bacterium]|nr:MAG: hypothetical protein DMG15_07320 [Acidobacteriota bacterium]